METQVIVVGGGPVGLGLAIELGQRGVSVVVIEREESVHRIPKGQNLTQRTMEHFRSWGVEEEVRAARVMPSDFPAAGINAYGSLMSGYAHPWFRRSEVDPYYFAANERLPQYLTEGVLRARVGEMSNVEGLFGVEARSVRDEGGAVLVEADNLVIEATYVVGCDGSRSTVRQAAGISEQQTGHHQRMALIVFRSTELHDLLEERFERAAFFNVLHPDLDGYWRFLGRVDVGEGWFFHSPVSDDSTVDSLDCGALLASAVGREFKLDLDYLGFWDLRIAMADTYQIGRVFIAGDAAHSHPPYGGYGINIGLEDARNLGWKLAADLQGWGGETLLASYTEERRPVFASTAQDFIAAFIEKDRAFVNRYDPNTDRDAFETAWEGRRSVSNRGVRVFDPHYEGSPIVFGPLGATSGAVGEHTFRPRPGHHLPPPVPDGTVGLYEALGTGFTLISHTADHPDVAGFRTASTQVGAPLDVLTSGDHPAVARYETGPILVRPDHFVSWVGEGSDHDALDVMARATGHDTRLS